jgi:hypothetical protein
LTKKEAKLITPEKVFELNGGWKVK